MCSNKIVLILPWYGSLPGYFGAWLRTVRGMVFDVMFVSDVAVDTITSNKNDIPCNFHMIHMSKIDFCRLASSKLGVSVNIDMPRKLCDLKPMYGKIFEEYISSYDWWAFGDLDLVYGLRFNTVLESVVVSQYDVATMRKCWISGPFSMFRNKDICRDLYSRCAGWEKVVGRYKENCSFDELGGEFFSEAITGEIDVDKCASFSGAVFSAYKNGEISLFHDDILTEIPLHGSDSVVVSPEDNGCRVFMHEEELCAFHLICVKGRRYFSQKQLPGYENDFLIEETGLFSCSEYEITRTLVRQIRKLQASVGSVRRNGIWASMKRLARSL